MFDMEALENFSFSDLLQKYSRTNPILTSAVVGSISKDKVENFEEMSRKGFGGRNSSLDIDLTPAVVIILSGIMHNRHPRSVSLVPCLMSLYLMANKVPGAIHEFFNSLGFCFR